MRSALILGSCLVLATSSVFALADDDHKAKHGSAAKSSAFEPFKALAGEWTGKMFEDGKEVGEATSSYKLTSGGSTLVETLGAGTPHEMVTVIHPDGDGLILTHYCAIGNQPRMRASGKSDPHKVVFEFQDITNAKSKDDMHMHSVTFTFVNKDEFKTEWTNFVGGKPAGKATFELKRKK